MPQSKKGRKRASPNVSQTPVDASSSKRRSPLPPQYDFTPAAVAQAPLQPVTSGSAPPPQLPIPSTGEGVRSYPPPQALFQSTGGSGSPLQQSAPALSQGATSSQGNNSPTDAVVLPELQTDTARALNALLQLPDRERFTTVLSPLPTAHTTW